jgi:D-lactate dehydrogenase (cytochrome)
MGSGNRRYAAREHGDALDLMRQVKTLFDPHGILNPGKMW